MRVGGANSECMLCIDFKSAILYLFSQLSPHIGTLWALGITSSLAYNYSRPIPSSLKLIHRRDVFEEDCSCFKGYALHAGPDKPPSSPTLGSRIYAQALTVGALLGAAGVELASPAPPTPVDKLEYKPHA